MNIRIILAGLCIILAIIIFIFSILSFHNNNNKKSIIYAIISIILLLFSSALKKENTTIGGAYFPPDYPYSGGFSAEEHEINNENEKRGGAREVEAKWLFVDKESLIKKIKEHKGEEVHKLAKYERYVFLLPEGDKRKGYVRTRKEMNDKGEHVITITGKFYDPASKYADEYEIETKNTTLEKCRDLLIAFGFRQKAYQESFRHKFHLDKCEICFDYLPGLEYVELDCADEDCLKDTSKKLGLDMKDAHYGSYGLTYEEVYELKQEILN